jgi:hypothetical protein
MLSSLEKSGLEGFFFCAFLGIGIVAALIALLMKRYRR